MLVSLCQKACTLASAFSKKTGHPNCQLKAGVSHNCGKTGQVSGSVFEGVGGRALVKYEGGRAPQ